MKHKPLVENAMIEPISDNVHINVLKANIWLANAIFFFFLFFYKEALLAWMSTSYCFIIWNHRHVRQTWQNWYERKKWDLRSW